MTLIKGWNKFWFGPISARPLGAFRILFGLVSLLNMALLSLELDYWLTDAGIFQGTEAREAAGPLRLSILNYVQDPTSVRIFFVAMTVVTVLFTLGWRTRTMSVLLYFSTLMIHHRNTASTSGADVLLVIVAFFLMFSPCGAAYSLDARRATRKRGTPADALILPWAQRLIQIQIALLYFNTAMLKASGPAWQDGTALHFVLNNAEIGRFNFGLAQFPLLVNFMTYAALMTEFALPFLLWFRASRPWAILLGIGLHLAITVTVNIPVFGELMCACYLTFLGVDEFDALLARADPRNWFRRRRQESATLVLPGRVDGPSDFQGPHRPVALPVLESVEVGSADRQWE